VAEQRSPDDEQDEEARPAEDSDDGIDEASEESFPASDPPATWSSAD
jgi:hypothetical protein